MHIWQMFQMPPIPLMAIKVTELDPGPTGREAIGIILAVSSDKAKRWPLLKLAVS